MPTIDRSEVPVPAVLLSAALALAACRDDGGTNPAPEDSTSGTTGDDGAVAEAGSSGDDGDTTSADPDPADTGDMTGGVQVGEPVATLTLVGTGTGAASLVTFGEVFAAGTVPDGLSVVARDESDDSLLPTQVDPKAMHGDGSLRHAVVTVRAPDLSAGETRRVILETALPSDEGEPLDPDVLADGSWSASLEIDQAGATYRADVAEALAQLESPETWLAGPLATEWTLVLPMSTADGTEHPHLVARVDLRVLGDREAVRVDATLENAWAFEDNPSPQSYDARMLVDGAEVGQWPDVVHYDHARWRHVAWSGATPALEVRHDPADLVAAGAVPAYDPTLEVSEQTLTRLAEDWAEAPREPMGIGLTFSGMPAGGARPDIGALPRWAARYVLSMDSRAKQATLGTGSLAGSWSIHYRDRDTDLPVSIESYPDLGLLAADDGFPACSGCDSPYTPDSAHQPSLAYLPYVVTGDRYYLEELHFWANWNVLRANPGSRGYDQGLVQWEQVRGQAWSLRTLAHAAFITPDDHPLRAYFEARVAHNLDAYAEVYFDDPDAPTLGFLEARTYDGAGVVPWMDDFFTHTLTWMVAMGFDEAAPMLAYKSTFPVGRVVDPGFCWVFASASALFVRDDDTSPYYDSFAELYEASVAPEIAALECGSAAMFDAAGLPAGAMDGYPFSPTGYPANLRPALAAAVDAGIDGAEEAWSMFVDREVKPTPADYADYPNFAIVPHSEWP